MRDYESASSISAFIQCPHAYYLGYVKGIRTPSSPAMEHGSDIHKQLELMPEHGDHAQEFVDAMDRYLEKEEDVLLHREHKFEFELDGKKFMGIIDAITEKGFIIDYKITTAPSNYAGKVGYQLPLYKIALEEGVPRFLLFKVSRGDRNYEKLLVHDVKLSDSLLSLKKKYILRIVEMIEMCNKDGIFPPSYSNCNTCFYRRHCEYYD